MESDRLDSLSAMAGMIGDEYGNLDRKTAVSAMAEKRILIQWGISIGAIDGAEAKGKQLVENKARAEAEAEAARKHDCALSLALQKRHALRARFNLPSARERLTSARLGTSDKVEYVEKEGITRDKLGTAGSPCLAIVAATVIKTINFPKGYVKQGEEPAPIGDFNLPDKQASKAQRKAALAGKGRRKLSPLEECEVFQTTAMVLIGNNALDLEISSDDTWRGEKGLWGKIYSACRDTLGIDRQAWGEIPLPGDDPIFLLTEAIATGYDCETVARARVSLARHVREWKNAIHADRDKSTNPKRKANARSAKATLRKIIAGNFTFAGMTQAELDSTSKAKARLVERVSKGKRLLAEAEAKRQAEAEALELARAMMALA